MTPTFPVLCFCRDQDPDADAGNESICWFYDDEDFSTDTTWRLRGYPRLGMLVVGADLRCWRVESVVDRGPIGPLWSRVIRFLLRHSVHRVDQQLVEVAPLSLEEVKARTTASIQANPNIWRDDEAIAGEDGPPRDEQEMLDELKAEALAATSVAGIINAVWEEALPEA